MKKLLTVLIVLLVIVLFLAVCLGSEYASANGESDYGAFALVLIAVTGLSVGIFVVAVIASYKTQLRGAIYPVDKFTTLDLTMHSDVYSHSHTTRYRYRSSKKK